MSKFHDFLRKKVEKVVKKWSFLREIRPKNRPKLVKMRQKWSRNGPSGGPVGSQWWSSRVPVVVQWGNSGVWEPGPIPRAPPGIAPSPLPIPRAPHHPATTGCTSAAPGVSGCPVVSAGFTRLHWDTVARSKYQLCQKPPQWHHSLTPLVDTTVYSCQFWLFCWNPALNTVRKCTFSKSRKMTKNSDFHGIPEKWLKNSDFHEI